MNMDVADYLKHARDCADMAAHMTGQDKQKLIELAKSWLKLAESAMATKVDGK
jgi:hypothetical protein